MVSRQPARQISREEWVSRFGDRYGIAGHSPPSLERQFNQGTVLGEGLYGKVHTSSIDPNVAIKRLAGDIYQRAEDPDGDLVAFLGNKSGPSSRPQEVDFLAYLGNELGLMPRIREVETPPLDSQIPHTYISMDNLASQGYTELTKVMKSKGSEDPFVKQLQVEQALNEAWAARAGIRAVDTHGNNVMVLPESRAAEQDGSRVKFIDAGLYQPLSGKGDGWSLNVQRESIRDGYELLGLSDMGMNFSDIVIELVRSGDLEGAKHVINDALSDLAVKQETITDAQLARNNAADERMRMAGGLWGKSMYLPKTLTPVKTPAWE